MKNKQNQGREDKSGNFEPNDIDFKYPAKKEQADQAEILVSCIIKMI